MDKKDKILQVARNNFVIIFLFSYSLIDCSFNGFSFHFPESHTKNCLIISQQFVIISQLIQVTPTVLLYVPPTQNEWGDSHFYH